jgi:hypothetical protein
VKEVMVKELEVQKLKVHELEVKEKEIRNSCPVVILEGKVDFWMAGTSGVGVVVLRKLSLLPFSI